MLILLGLISLTALAEKYPKTATGIEAGVTRLKNDNSDSLGTSWTWHFEYRPDKFAGFFGHAGQNRGGADGKNLQQNVFAGGAEIALLPVLDLRLGLVQSVSNGNTELGPLLGLAVSKRAGIWRPGVLAEVIRAGEIHAFSLRGFFYFDP